MIGLLAAALSGAGLARAAGLRGWLAVAAAIALGLGAESATWAAATLLSTQNSSVWAELALTAAAASLLVATPRQKKNNFFFGGVSDPFASPGGWLWALFGAACLVCAAAFIEHTWRFPDGGWDAWMVWNLRARFFFRGDFRAAFSPDMLFLAHQDYPFLLPGLVAQGFALIGREHPLVPELIAALFGALALAILSLGVARLYGSRTGLLAGLALATMPCFPIFASNQQSDVPLAVYLLLAALLIELEAPVIAGFSAGLAAWTKNEGAMYAALLALALLWRTRDLRRTARFSLGALPCALLFLCFKLHTAPANDLAALSTQATVLHHALDLRRWGELAVLVLRRIVYFQDFALWLAAEVCLLVYLRKRRPGVTGTALLLSCAAYVPIYVLQPHPLQWIFCTSADRLVIQLWPAAILATVSALAPARTTART